jgi:predicted nuclease with TOPRIM domain
MANFLWFNYISEEEFCEVLMRVKELEAQVGYKEMEKDVWVSEYLSIESTLDEANRKLSQLESDNASLQSNLESERNRNKECNRLIEEMQKEIEYLKKIGSLKSEIDHLSDLRVNPADDILSKNSLKMPDQASSEETFVKQYLAGKISFDSIDNFIDQWHQGGTGTTIWEFLGFSKEQYSSWVETGSIPFPK